VRLLGFEDTPDYDYLRDLFTQALKATGEVEDGEYDWMRLLRWSSRAPVPSRNRRNNRRPPLGGSRGISAAARRPLFYSYLFSS